MAANLPYNVGTRILFDLLEGPVQFSRLALMLQREVAERIVAEPRSKAYGAMTLQVAELSEARIAFRVNPGAFTPPPKEDSAVVVLRPHASPLIEDCELSARFREVVTAGFAMRRKTLRNALGAALGKAEASAAIERAGLDARARAEELGFDDFLRLAAATHEQGDQ